MFAKSNCDNVFRTEAVLFNKNIFLFPKLMEIHSKTLVGRMTSNPPLKQDRPCTVPFLTLSLLCSNVVGLGKGVHMPTLPI